MEKRELLEYLYSNVNISSRNVDDAEEYQKINDIKDVILRVIASFMNGDIFTDIITKDQRPHLSPYYKIIREITCGSCTTTKEIDEKLKFYKEALYNTEI